MVNGEAQGVNGPSQAAIARALNLSPAAITKLKQQGMPVDSVESAQRWRQERQNVAQRKPAPVHVKSAPPMAAEVSSSSPNLYTSEGRAQKAPESEHVAPPDEYLHGESHDAARTRREIAEADLAELKLRELRGELVRLADVRGQYARLLASIREAFLQMPARVVPLLAEGSTPEGIDMILRREINSTLQILVDAD